MVKHNAHPYIPSYGILTKTIDQLRSSFPIKLDSTVLKKLSLAPNNETYVLQTLRFLGFIDEKGNRTDKGQKVFTKHIEQEFNTEFEKAVKESYKELFGLHGEKAWALNRDGLIAYFRNTDNTSSIVASRQAIAFETLAALSGHSVKKQQKSESTHNQKAASIIPRKHKVVHNIKGPEKQEDEKKLKGLGLTVRIEINLPAQANQEIYDRIFQSIKRNLIDA